MEGGRERVWRGGEVKVMRGRRRVTQLCERTVIGKGAWGGKALGF